MVALVAAHPSLLGTLSSRQRSVGFGKIHILKKCSFVHLKVLPCFHSHEDVEESVTSACG